MSIFDFDYQKFNIECDILLESISKSIQEDIKRLKELGIDTTELEEERVQRQANC